MAAPHLLKKIVDWRPDQGPFAIAAEILLLSVAAGLAVMAADRFVPPQHLPWKPLELDQPLGAFTRAKLDRAEGSGCRAILERGGVRFSDVAERASGYCTITDAGRLEGAALRPAGPVMTCNAALALSIWERQVVRPAAAQTLKTSVTAIEHYGTYACRRVYGAEQGRVSEHARANAVDVSGFVLADGRRLTLARDWKGPGDETAFLRRVRDGACGLFGVTLSPDYNTAHADHLHFDRGRGRLCR